MTNVTPPPAGTRPVTTPTATARRNQIIALAVFVIVLVFVVRACAGGENRYERIVHQFTQAVQNNDMAAAAKVENVGTAADTSRARFGLVSDRFNTLGKIRRVKEATPSGDAPRVHEFDVTFEKGTVHEKIEFDPQDKIYHWHYDWPPLK